MTPIHGEHDDEEREGGTTRGKRPQKKISLELKLEIISCWERRSRSRAELSKKYGVSKTTAHRIIKDRQTLKDLASELSRLSVDM
jgi:Mor family transcriptional regulator